MSWMHTCLPSKDTSLWRPSLTTESPRRSPRCRINSPSCRAPKTRRLRNNTYINCPRPTNKRAKLPLHYPCPMRCNYNGLNLPAPNRPKIINCLLLSQPHRSSSRWNSYPNTMRLYRSPNPNDCPRPHFLRTILPSQHKL